MFSALTDYGVSGRAVDNGLVDIAYFNPREFTQDKHRTVDDRPYGGGPGMVMLLEPLLRAVETAKDWIAGETKVVYLSPQGQLLDQGAVNKFAEVDNVILIYKKHLLQKPF